jgi:hypothetical protein
MHILRKWFSLSLASSLFIWRVADDTQEEACERDDGGSDGLDALYFCGGEGELRWTKYRALRDE